MMDSGPNSSPFFPRTVNLVLPLEFADIAHGAQELTLNQAPLLSFPPSHCRKPSAPGKGFLGEQQDNVALTFYNLGIGPRYALDGEIEQRRNVHGNSVLRYVLQSFADGFVQPGVEALQNWHISVKNA